MAKCPGCLGEGGYDLRYTNALLSEHLTDEELAMVSNRDVEWLDCVECDATGVVSQERFAELHADARIQVERALNRVAQGRTI